MIPATADTRYVWSPVYVDAMVLRDRDADGNSGTGLGGLEERMYALQDGNWNTTALIVASGVPGKASGDVIQRFVYTPYGEDTLITSGWVEQSTPPEVPWQYLFQGLKFTEGTGLGYVRNRDYSPNLGRFIELDPVGFEAGDKNLYCFVGNQPTQATDPTGLAPQIVIALLPCIKGAVTSALFDIGIQYAKECFNQGKLTKFQTFNICSVAVSSAVGCLIGYVPFPLPTTMTGLKMVLQQLAVRGGRYGASAALKFLAKLPC
jgi:RHS repeat-associated protein